jgi:uncharacterized protein involved in exopolysaccharide biosynthesis
MTSWTLLALGIGFLGGIVLLCALGGLWNWLEDRRR